MKQAIMTAPGKIEIRDVESPSPARARCWCASTASACAAPTSTSTTASIPLRPTRSSRATSSRRPRSRGHRGHRPEPGLKVTATPQVVCGECAPCRRGDYHICDVLRGAGLPGARLRPGLGSPPRRRSSPCPIRSPSSRAHWSSRWPSRCMRPVGRATWRAGEWPFSAQARSATSSARSPEPGGRRCSSPT